MRSDLLNSNSNALSLIEAGATSCLKQTVSFTADSASIASGAMVIPKDAVIRS